MVGIEPFDPATMEGTSQMPESRPAATVDPLLAPVSDRRLPSLAALVAALCASLAAVVVLLPAVAVAQGGGTEDPCPNAELRTGPSAGLADCRAFELVSPAYKPAGIGVGGVYESFGSLAASGFGAHTGDRFASMGAYGSTLDEEGFSNVQSWSFAERTGQGWQNDNPLKNPYYRREVTKFVGVAEAAADLSRVVWDANGALPLFPEMADGSFGDTQLFLGDWAGQIELLAPTGPGQFASGAGGGPVDDAETMSVAVSADGSRTLTSGEFRGMAGPGSADLDRVAGESVYVADTSGTLANSVAGVGERVLANVCTDGGGKRTQLPERRVDGTFGEQACPPPPAGRDARLISPFGASMVADAGNLPTSAREGLVSANGLRAFFMSPDPRQPATANPATRTCTADVGELTACPPQLYVRQENGDGSVTTRWISRPVDGLLGSQQAGLLGQTIWEGASDDGDKVFFRSNSPLTADDPNGVKDGGGAVVTPPPGGVTVGSKSNVSWDLYMYDMPDAADADPGDGTLTRITGGPSGDADCNIPQEGSGNFAPLGRPAAGLRFVSTDGSRVYFTCASPLPDVEAPSNGTITSPGGSSTEAFPTQTNLYLYEANPAGPARWTFVARIPRSTAEDAKSCASVGGPERMPRGPDWTGSIGPIGNCVRGTDDGTFITFFTDGRLTADDPDALSGDIYGYDAIADRLIRLSEPNNGLATSYTCGNGEQCYADTGWESWGNLATRAMPANTLLGVGGGAGGQRVAFFQSASRLVAEDVNDVYDVYMWRDGDLSLVSTGAAGAEPALYKGNDRTGTNVYLVTREKLSWQDVDAVADIYVARVDGGIPRPPEPVVCGVLVDACQPGGSTAGLSVVSETSGSAAVGNADAGVRKQLTVAGLGRKARLRAARTGVIRLRVRTNGVGRVSAVARGRVGRRVRPVARGSVEVRRAGSARLMLRLSRAAKRRLRAGRDLSLSIRVGSSGVRARAITVRLPGAGS